MSAAKHTPGPVVPTYYVRHPDGSISIAQPQPTDAQIAEQSSEYAQCDRQHGGSVCSDPACHHMPLERVRAAAPDLLRVAELLVDWLDEEPGAHKLCDTARAAIAKATGSAS